jgi:hypothetical protein
VDIRDPSVNRADSLLGISSVTYLPFSPPIAFRTVPHVPKTSRQRTSMREGQCHKCKKWVQLDTVKKDTDVKVRLPVRPAAITTTDDVLGQGTFLVEARCELPW